MPARYPQRFGQYVLLHPLGSGGMGRVFLGLAGQEGLETVVVIKRMLAALLARPEAVERFRHEADLARRLTHGNLVHTHAVGELGGEVFIVQEYVEGQDVMALLDKLAGERRKLPIEVSLYIAASVARGLEFAHDFQKLELVHRDINPPNVRLTYDGEVKLLDFGIASSKLQGEEGIRNKPIGKLAYMAPEQVAGARLDRRTDLYAVGVLLWELLTGHPLGTTMEDGEIVVPEDGRQDAFQQILNGNFLPPSTFNPKVPPELDGIVLKLLSGNPASRMEGAAAVRAALMPFIPPGFNAEQALAHEMLRLFPRELERAERERLTLAARELPASASPAGPPIPTPAAPSTEISAPRRGSRSSRKPALLIAGGVAAAVVLVALIGLGLGSKPSDEPTTTAVQQVPEPRSADQPPAPATPPVEAPVPTAPTVVDPAPEANAAPTTPASARRLAANSRPAKPALAPSPKQPVHQVNPALPPPEKDGGVKALATAREAFHDREWKAALENAKTAARQGAGAEAHALLGATYFKLAKYEDAEREYTTAQRLDPSDTRLPKLLNLVRQTRAETTAKPSPGP